MTKLLNFGNDEMIRATLQCLELNADDVYIDIGFGGGRALELAFKMVTAGRLYGIDFSPDVVTAAQNHEATSIALSSAAPTRGLN